MANAVGKEIEGKVVVLSHKYYNKGGCTEEPRTRAFLATDGFGTSPDTIGSAVFGKFLIDGEEARVEGWQIERLATEQESKDWLSKTPTVKPEKPRHAGVLITPLAKGKKGWKLESARHALARKGIETGRKKKEKILKHFRKLKKAPLTYRMLAGVPTGAAVGTLIGGFPVGTTVGAYTGMPIAWELGQLKQKYKKWKTKKRGKKK